MILDLDTKTNSYCTFYQQLRLLLFFSFLSLIIFPNNLISQNLLIEMVRTENPPQIDGFLNDTVWQKAPLMESFKQTEPYWDAQASLKTEVRILYDNKAIYIAARMFDNEPDKIVRQLGFRDSDLNADDFSIEFDPYNKMQDAYTFHITASGVQSEWRRSDASYDAVWKSKVQIDSLGWSAEMEIPYSAFSFPKTETQNWKIQFYRQIRRYREIDSWIVGKQFDDNDIQYWAKTNNMNSIKPPLRLFLQPFVNANILTSKNENGEHQIAKNIKGGLDLKWGINQSLSLDVTLLPDFSQVQSDNLVKNLTAFEIEYDDYRPFFNESISMFQKGGLLYTRRIGSRPMNYDLVENQLDTNEIIENNPYSSPLINALKFYGKLSNGISLGWFNAVTDNTNAVIKNIDNGSIREIQTSPLTNYSILVVEKDFNNKSNIYFNNASTIRSNNFGNANVSLLGSSIYFGEGNFNVDISGAISSQHSNFQNIINNENGNNNGFQYDLSIGKVSGKWIYSLNRNLKDKNYNPNDLGLNHINNQATNFFTISRRLTTPIWKILNFNQTLKLSYDYRLSNQKPTNISAKYSYSLTSKKHLTIWGNAEYAPFNVYDFYEARMADFYFLQSPSLNFEINFSTDYRHPFAIDWGYVQKYETDFHANELSFYLKPIFRIGNSFYSKLRSDFTFNKAQRGFAQIYENEPLFGKRELNIFENTAEATYMVNSKLGLTFRARHYWANGEYQEYYKLLNNGQLGDIVEVNNLNNDFTYSVFNIDFGLQWEFAPGSMLYFTYKNEFLQETNNADMEYFRYLQYAFDDSQSNMFSIKLIYHFDLNSVIYKK